MTVKQLKKILDRFDDNTRVVVQYRDGNGDYAGADKNVYFGVGYVKGEGYDSFSELIYGESDEGEKVVVL